MPCLAVLVVTCQKVRSHRCSTDLYVDNRLPLPVKVITVAHGQETTIPDMKAGSRMYHSARSDPTRELD